MSDFAAREAARWRALAYDALNHAAELEAAGNGEPPAAAVDAGFKRLALVVGHQKTAPGAMAVEPINAPEYEWCGEMAFAIAEAGRTLGIKVLIERRDQGGIKGAYARVRAWKPDAAIELHFNSFSATATGTETLVLVDVPGEQAFAQAVQAAMVDVLGLADRGVKAPHPQRGAVALGQLDVPHILIEPFFGSNPSDCHRAHARKPQLAAAITHAAAAFMKGR